MSERQGQRLKVYLRQRPFATADGALNIIDSATEKEIRINCKNQTRQYKVDHVFGEGASQLDLYSKVVTPYINDAISGYNCTVFAYGPTGTGKTYTIWGENLQLPHSRTAVSNMLYKRDCKLTRVLQESLGGNVKTSMIATFLPMTQTLEETVATLETAAVARNIINSPTINITRKPNDVYLEEELSRLKKELAATENKLGCCMTSDEYEKISEEIAAQDLNRMDLIDQIRKLEDFKQTLTDDYMKLMFSFEITKESLKEKKEELEKRSQAVQEQEEIVKHLEEHDTEATEAVDTIFKICETMLDDKMTYHEKYDKQQDITRRNADDAQLLINNCLNGLEKIKFGYHNYTEGLESRITQQEEFINPIASRNKEILKFNDHLCREVFEKTNSKAAQLSGLFEEFNTDLPTKSFKNIQEHIQKKDEIFETLQQKILLHNHDKLAKDKDLQKIIDKQLTTKGHFFTDSHSQFDKLNKNFEDANDVFEKKVELDSQFNKTFMQYFQQNGDLSENFEKHTKSMGDSIHNCSLLAEAFQIEAKNTRIDQLTKDYISYIESVDSDEQQAVNHLLKKINETEANYSDTITSHTDALKIRNNQMKNTIEQRMDASNQKNLKMLNDWSEKTSIVSSRLEENRDGLAKMQKDVEDLEKNNTVDFEKNLDFLLEEVRELGDKLKNGINYAIHDGDTPAKRTLNYPKMPKFEQHRLAALFDEPEDSEDPQ